MPEGNPNIPISSVPMMWGFQALRSDQGRASVMLRIAHPMGTTQLLFLAEDFERFTVDATEAVKAARRLPAKLEIAKDLPPLPENGQGPR